MEVGTVGVGARSRDFDVNDVTKRRGEQFLDALASMLVQNSGPVSLKLDKLWVSGKVNVGGARIGVHTLVCRQGPTRLQTSQRSNMWLWSDLEK